jgi:hypothetical protein
MSRRGDKMAKYLVLWQWDDSKMPTEANERTAAFQKIMETTKQYFKEHPGEEWGNFPGEHKGYWIGATKWQDIARVSEMFTPYFKVEVNQAISLTEFEEFYKSMMPQK